MLTRKDIFIINQQFSTGTIINESSLDFVLKQTYRSRHWYKAMCLLTRTILLDHVFEDGNKRTAAAIIMTYHTMNGQECNPDLVSRAVLHITKHNITSINTIGRIIHHATP